MMRSVFRIVIAFLFMEHGGQKLLNFPPSPHPMSHLPLLLLAAGVLELCGGFLVLVGVFTRPVAFILACEMAVAYVHQHAPQGPWPIYNMGELALLYGIGFLYLAVAGGGPLSLERLWHRGR